MALSVHKAYERGAPWRESGTPDPLPNYLNRIGGEKLLNHEQEIRLSRRAKASDRRARDTIIGNNRKPVVSVAKKCRTPSRGSQRSWSFPATGFVGCRNERSECSGRGKADDSAVA